MEDIKKERELVWLQILYLFIVPVLLLYFKVLPGNFRFIMLFTVALLLYGIVKHAKWTYSDLGIHKGYMKDIIPYSIFTAAGVFFLIWLAKIVPHESFLGWWQNAKFLILFIPISILQEIIFRGILMNMLLRAFRNPIFIIVLNACVFSLMHVIYLNSTFVLPMTFIAGIGFAWMYYKYENLPLISISHTILNFTAMILGFFIIR
jgi:membrane protease YdiL (CAAX protease family)